MKFTILRNELAGALSAVLGAVSRGGSLQILSHVLIEARDGKVLMMGTDLEMELRAETAATVDVPGRATVSARKLADLVKGMPEGAEIRLEFEERKALMKCGRSRYTLPVLPAMDMPALDPLPLEKGITFQVEERALKQVMQRVLFAVADDDARKYLTGMLLDLIDGELRAVGGSHVSMGVASAKVPGSPLGKVQVILINKPAREIARLLSETEHLATVRVCPSMIQIDLSSCSIRTKSIESRYPEYDRVMEQNTQSTLTVDRDALKAALARAAITANAHKGLRLITKPDALELESRMSDNECGGDSVEAKYEGPDEFEIGFSAVALSEIVSALPAGDVVVQFESPKRHALIRSAASNDCRYAIMPMVI